MNKKTASELAYSLRAKGLSDQQIADKLTAKGYVTKSGNEYTAKSIYMILYKSKYRAEKKPRRRMKRVEAQTIEIPQSNGYCIYGSPEFLADFIKRAS